MGVGVGVGVNRWICRLLIFHIQLRKSLPVACEIPRWNGNDR